MKKQVKGFTLIELIVVLAIFSVILFSAISLMTPASKIMFSASTNEAGNAYTTNIATQLENEFGSAEYLDCYNTIENMDARVRDFAEFYYEGILRSGSTTASPNYGEGLIHVMVIDNTPDPTSGVNSTIEKYVYNADFTTNAVSVTLDPTGTVPSAINKAAYDDYNYEIKMGNWDDSNWSDEMTNAILDDASQAAGFTFTIRATTNRPRNGSLYSFYKEASTPLVNIANPNKRYYALNETHGTNPGDPNVFTIGEIRSVSNRDSDPTLSNSRKSQLSMELRRLYNTVASGSTNTSYMFIYSYGVEINTNP